jgi:hypothetical protein
VHNYVFGFWLLCDKFEMARQLALLQGVCAHAYGGPIRRAFTALRVRVYRQGLPLVGMSGVCPVSNFARRLNSRSGEISDE